MIEFKNMTKEEKKELRKAFKLTSKLAEQHLISGSNLDKLINKHWKEHYSENDIDELIDCLDYGTATMSFDSFLYYMNDKCGPYK